MQRRRFLSGSGKGLLSTLLSLNAKASSQVNQGSLRARKEYLSSSQQDILFSLQKVFLGSFPPWRHGENDDKVSILRDFLHAELVRKMGDLPGDEKTELLNFMRLLDSSAFIFMISGKWLPFHRLVPELQLEVVKWLRSSRLRFFRHPVSHARFLVLNFSWQGIHAFEDAKSKTLPLQGPLS